MSYLERKRDMIMSVQNTMRGYLRTVAGKTPLTINDTYPDKMKVKLWGKSTQNSGIYYTANHTITTAECNYSTRKLLFGGGRGGDGYVGIYYVLDDFTYWCFVMDYDCGDTMGYYYIDCLEHSIFHVDYNGVETLYPHVTVTHSATIPSGYTDFSSYIYDRTGNAYLFGGTSCSLGAVNGKYANFMPGINLVSGTKLLYDSYTPSLTYRQPSESVDTAITFTESATAAKKNWLTYPYVDTSKAENGVTWTDNGNGSITVSGTPTELTMFTLCSSLVIPSGNYEVDFPTLEDNNLLVSITINGTTTSHENPFGFIVTAETTITLKIRNKIDDIAIPTITFTVSLLSDSTILSAENVTSKTYPDTVHPQTITSPTAGGTVRGKNLFDISTVITNTMVVNNITYLQINASPTSAGVSAGGANTLKDYAPNLAIGKEYTLSITSTGTNKYIYLSGVNFSWNYGTAKTMTQAMLDSKVLFYASGVNTQAQLSNIQFELGSTATPYSPYQAPVNITITKDGQPVKLYGLPVASGGNVTIGGQQYLSDVLTDNGDGTGTVERNADVSSVPTGWNIAVTQPANTDYISYGANVPLKKIGTPILTTHFSVVTNAYVSTTATESAWYNVGAIQIGLILKKSNLSSLDREGVNAYLASLGDIKVYYTKATPTYEPVTITKNKAVNGTTVITSDCPYIGAEYYSWEREVE